MTAIVNVLFVLIILAGGDPPTPPPPFPPVWPPTDPLTHTVALPNADFESGLVGWQTWSEDTGKPADASTLDYAVAPFFSVEHNPLLVHTGQASLHVGRIYDPWHAGLKRSINVPPGAQVQFCIDGRLYASNRDFGHESSWSSLDGHMQAGIYPNGEADWNASGIAWSDAANPHDEWQPICIEAVAGSTGRITLFASTNYRGVAAKHLDAWWDDAELTISGGVASSSLGTVPFALSGLTSTQAVSVLLLIPAQPIMTSTSSFVVVPAQVYVSTQGMTLAVTSRSSALSGSIALPTTATIASGPTEGSAMVAPTLQAAITPTPQSVSSVTHQGSEEMSATTTPPPTATASPQGGTLATITPRPISATATARPAATVTSVETSVPTTVELPTSNPSATQPGLIGLGVLFAAGVGGALILARRR
ncbi:hypothetical protein ANRL4_05142 [Anaerolineae bacterium]|nr:hypothetical protein ANRL4_05142 [Anaerolineae bacterium]